MKNCKVKGHKRTKKGTGSSHNVAPHLRLYKGMKRTSSKGKGKILTRLIQDKLHSDITTRGMSEQNLAMMDKKGSFGRNSYLWKGKGKRASKNTVGRWKNDERIFVPSRRNQL